MFFKLKTLHHIIITLKFIIEVITMNIQNQVRNQINQFEAGKLFTYSDLTLDISSQNSVSQAVNRLVKSGEIRRLTKGKFYKPQKGILGERALSDDEKLKSVLFSNNKRVGYITGIALFNRLGITTQVPSVITVAVGKGQWSKKVFNNLTIKIVPAYAEVMDENIPYLEILDIIVNIKKIPDSLPDNVIKSLKYLLKKLDNTQLKQLTTLSLKYPPSTRALLGMLLDKLGVVGYTCELKTSLNPLTIYKFGLDESTYTKKWNIR